MFLFVFNYMCLFYLFVTYNFALFTWFPVVPRLLAATVISLNKCFNAFFLDQTGNFFSAG